MHLNQRANSTLSVKTAPMISKELRKFKKYRGIIKKCLKDLKKAFNSISEDEFNAHFLHTSGIETKLSSNIENYCVKIAESDIAIIILGQNNYAKAALVNEIFQKELLPISDTSIEEQSLWRLINIHHGQQNSASLCSKETLTSLDDHMTSCIEKFINEDPADEEDKNREINRQTTYLDITLNDTLLLPEGVRVIVSPSCRHNNADELCTVFQTATVGVLPIFIYAVECKSLTPWDLIELTELRRLALEHSIMFAIVPPKQCYRTHVKSRDFNPPARQRNARNTDGLARDWKLGCMQPKPGQRRPSSSNRKELMRYPTFLPIRNSNAKEDGAGEVEQQSNVGLQSVKKPVDISWHPVESTATQPTISPLTITCSLASTTESINELGQMEFQARLLSILVQLGFLSSPDVKDVPLAAEQSPASPDSGTFSLTNSVVKQSNNGPSLKHASSFTLNSCYLKPNDNEIDMKADLRLLVSSELVCSFQKNFEGQLHAFIRRRLQSYLFWSLREIDTMATNCLKEFVLQAYDLAHDLVITPKRLEFTRTQEAKLYQKLLENAKYRQQSILTMVTDKLRQMRDVLPEMAARDLHFGQPSVLPLEQTSSNASTQQRPDSRISTTPCGAQNTGVEVVGTISSSEFGPTPITTELRNCSASMISYPDSSVRAKSLLENSFKSSGSRRSLYEYKQAMKIVRDYVVHSLTNEIAAGLLECMEVMRQSCVGTLERTIACLEHLKDKELSTRYTSSCPFLDLVVTATSESDLLALPGTLKSPSSSPHRHGGWERTESQHHDNKHDYPVDEYHDDDYRRMFQSVGSGHRMSTQLRCDHIGSSSRSVSAAFRALLTFTYDLQIPMTRTTGSQLYSLFEKLKEVFKNPLVMRPNTDLDAAWVARSVRAMLNGLSEAAIARRLCAQIMDKLRQSHENFLTTLHQLKVRTEIRTCRFEEAQENILRQHAPRLSRIVLETSSLENQLQFGLPSLGRELGRGQYGVVYTCANWGGHSRLAVKSVVPPDEKHWKDLALEVFYSKQIPAHERIVTMYASVIDYDHAHGSQPAVLLIMERLVRDLHTAIKQGLPWLNRLVVAQDVAEGMRYLHGQGLVHRDIKPRNVLLDFSDRAKLTDMGFCKPQAMIGGSILGTPMHMAPEIFEQNYDSSVDVYAFGILFWYICAGRMQMPHNFEQCGDKDVLWRAVRKGMRPERLTNFSKDCWDLMEQCWSRNPRKRPHSGQIMCMLEHIYEEESNGSHGTASIKKTGTKTDSEPDPI
ncbi:hypothetical protein EG68_05723 [Paragonimus skrjabini miyazakii]|uniref:Dual serine/threonine and tyrosine protein kinase n=1 Tax=Paragonimus skrjabini miyazakii TaxID=59628 RepID=A0A8S9YZN8_9TREM|nr:hypothetical protein EG68_05723 [Paragonimus skrjabini miyazakii]